MVVHLSQGGFNPVLGRPQHGAEGCDHIITGREIVRRSYVPESDASWGVRTVPLPSMMHPFRCFASLHRLKGDRTEEISYDCATVPGLMTPRVLGTVAQS